MTSLYLCHCNPRREEGGAVQRKMFEEIQLKTPKKGKVNLDFCIQKKNLSEIKVK